MRQCLCNGMPIHPTGGRLRPSVSTPFRVSSGFVSFFMPLGGEIAGFALGLPAFGLLAFSRISFWVLVFGFPPIVSVSFLLLFFHQCFQGLFVNRVTPRLVVLVSNHVTEREISLAPALVFGSQDRALCLFALACQPVLAALDLWSCVRQIDCIHIWTQDV